MSSDIPPHVESFIADHIDSVELIEVLLLLRRNPGQEWTPLGVSQRLYTSPGSAANRLQALCSSGLAQPTEGSEETTYRYAPVDPELDRAARDLERLYEVRRTTVINMVFSKPSEKLRTFSDAFRLRDKKS